MTNRKKIKISGTKFRWDRNQTLYRVGAVLDERKSEGGWPVISKKMESDYCDRLKKGWSSVLIELNSPITMQSDVCRVIDTGRLRIYPPFELNRKARVTEVLKEVKIPVGAESATEWIDIPDYAIKGLQVEIKYGDGVSCYGLRIDHEDGFEYDEPLENFLRIVKQYTKQWWIASAHNPFDSGLRVLFEIETDYRPREVLRKRGLGEAKAPWFGATATQGIIGFEQAVTCEIWEQVETAMKSGYGIEEVVQYFFAAVTNYMSYEDNQTIMNLALMFEVAENKYRILTSTKTLSRNKHILKDPLIANDSDISVFREIITDRDNIAHGRKPYHYLENPEKIVNYLEKSAEYINRYLERCRAIGWNKALQVSL